MLYKLQEWKDAVGYWRCEHTESYPKDVVKWVVPARLMGISPAEFLQWLIDNYKPDTIHHNEDSSLVFWGWKSITQMRKYKNYINKLSREQNFQI